jgi:hypothetical protein
MGMELWLGATCHERRREKVMRMDAVVDALALGTVEWFRRQHADQEEEALSRRQLEREPRCSVSVVPTTPDGSRRT